MELGAISFLQDCDTLAFLHVLLSSMDKTHSLCLLGDQFWCIVVEEMSQVGELSSLTGRWWVAYLWGEGKGFWGGLRWGKLFYYRGSIGQMSSSVT